MSESTTSTVSTGKYRKKDCVGLIWARRSVTLRAVSRRLTASLCCSCSIRRKISPPASMSMARPINVLHICSPGHACIQKTPKKGKNKQIATTMRSMNAHGSTNQHVAHLQPRTYIQKTQRKANETVTPGLVRFSMQWGMANAQARRKNHLSVVWSCSDYVVRPIRVLHIHAMRTYIQETAERKNRTTPTRSILFLHARMQVDRRIRYRAPQSDIFHTLYSSYTPVSPQRHV